MQTGFNKIWDSNKTDPQMFWDPFGLAKLLRAKLNLLVQKIVIFNLETCVK